jgi:hypothetical protein
VSEPVIQREVIAQQADAAARAAVACGAVPANPYPIGSDTAAEWARRYHIALLRHSPIEGTEASA